MSFGAISIGLGLLLLSTYVIVTPWRTLTHTAGTRAATKGGLPEPATTPASMEDRRDAAYAALADLDLDYELGKVNVDDYQRTRAGLLTQAVAALQGLDEAQTGLEAQVETLVQSRRASLSKCGNCGGALEPGEKFCCRCGAPTPARCPKCNCRTAADDRFCRACGTPLG